MGIRPKAPGEDPDLGLELIRTRVSGLRSRVGRNQPRAGGNQPLSDAESGATVHFHLSGLARDEAIP